jgi:dTDP-4-dehydrorhamnose 3,5-epimerase
MNLIKTKLNDCYIIEPKVFSDERGFFLETFHQERYLSEVGIKHKFIQDNYSRSKKNIIRGMHFQLRKPQGKLVRVVRGEVFDVAVDIRPDSSTFGEWDSVVLSEENKKQMWIPPGFAHGFMVLSDFADFEYKCTSYYDPADESGFIWNDKDINIKWPLGNAITGSKDTNLKSFAHLKL